jgi:flagellar basal-body rod modification protein FlgD
MAITNNYQDIGLRTVQSNSASVNSERTELGQDDFLKLMTTQLGNQDPFEPMDNGEFLAQIAQFGTVNGVNELNASFSGFASSLQSSQALQAASLIGHQVLVKHDESYLSKDGLLTGGVELGTSASDVSVNILDDVGQTVARVDLGPQQQGLVVFAWDGKTLDGQQAVPGRYKMEIEATIAGQTESIQPLVAANVVSLTLADVGQEMQVELENLGTVNFSQVTQIQ